MFSIHQQRRSLKTTLKIQKAVETNVRTKAGRNVPLGSQLADEAKTDEFHTCFGANKLQHGGGAA